MLLRYGWQIENAIFFWLKIPEIIVIVIVLECVVGMFLCIFLTLMNT